MTRFKKFNSNLKGILFVLLGILVVIPSASFFFASIDRTPQVVQNVIPSVVSIEVYSKKTDKEFSTFVENFNSFIEEDRPYLIPDTTESTRETGSGSGFVYTDDGLIITNHHVIEKGDLYYVRMHDDRIFLADLVESDEEIDLAVLQLIDIEDYNLKPVKWQNSDKIAVGERVVAVGSPFGLGISVTKGIVSATGRVQKSTYDDYIQTDASINPGNSGGPSFNSSGKVIGVNTSIYSRSGGSVGVGFLIPSNLARFVADQLIDDGKIHRGWLGVRVTALTYEEALENKVPKSGVMIHHVVADSPAHLNGLEVGDILIEVDDRTLNEGRDLVIATTRTAPGDEIYLVFLRKGEYHEIFVTLSELEEDTIDNKA